MYVCVECGHRQPAGGACARCTSDPTLDLDKPDTRDLLVDVEQRLGDRREARIRWGSVVGAVAFVFALWLVPGYWSLRGDIYPGLPFFADQWLFMIAIGLGSIKVCERVFKARRFPFLDET